MKTRNTKYGVQVYQDTRNLVLRVRLEGGAIGELLLERQLDGPYRNQLMIVKNQGDVSLFEGGARYATVTNDLAKQITHCDT